jgi:hypothetical protein
MRVIVVHDDVVAMLDLCSALEGERYLLLPLYVHNRWLFVIVTLFELINADD